LSRIEKYADFLPYINLFETDRPQPISPRQHGAMQGIIRPAAKPTVVSLSCQPDGCLVKIVIDKSSPQMEEY